MANNNLTPPRSVPSRDDKYMGLAFWHASFSKDPNTQMGAVIISPNNIPLGSGYNGPPKEIKDDAISWGRPDKYDFMIHAEENAIEYSFGSLEGASLYVTGKPCKKCMLMIVRSGIKHVIYFPHKTKDSSSMFNGSEVSERTDEIARLGGVTLREFKGNLNWMRDRIQVMKKLGIFK